jgi:hypothetical protein
MTGGGGAGVTGAGARLVEQPAASSANASAAALRFIALA